MKWYCRGDQNRVGIARQINVRHIVGDTRIPLIGIDRIARQSLHGHWRDELRRALGHHHLHGSRTKLAY